MSTAIDVYFIVILVIMCVSGITLNSSIITVYFRDWRKKQHFIVCDKIFLSMALTNVVLQCVMAINVWLYCFWTHLLYVNQSYLYLFVVQFFLIYGNFWHTAWLSVHYCLKLVNYSHNFFLFLKKRLSSSILQLLIMTLVGSFFINLPFIWTMKLDFLQNVTENSSSTNYFSQSSSLFIPFNMVIGCCLPVIVALICIGLSVKSLLGHVWRMKQNTSQFSSSPQLKVHVRAARTMILQVLFNSLMYLAIFGICLSSFNLDTIWKVVLWTIIMSYPSAQTVTLILGNPKLNSKLFGQDIAS
ncbi:taste receptor type 2 member 40-like [Mixophyes fleayi]|uniref:taste receptor type 2 member 40-like n=1 Tax=Mixophyes fleayi TaxID=3061075 RepID=UPI003F4DC33A